MCAMMAAAARKFRAVASVGAGGARAPVSMVTYNILADKYATSGWHNYCPPQYLNWSYRGPAILQEILEFGADIICLQEVEHYFFKLELEPLMGSHGYEALYFGRRVRPTDRIKGPEDGIVLLYRSTRLARVASKIVRFGDMVDPGWKGGFWGRVRELGEGCIWAVLQDRQAGQPVLVGCTHLFWDPRWPDAKVAQAHLLCQAAQQLLQQSGVPHRSQSGTAVAGGRGGSLAPPFAPVLLGGDFNSLPAKWISDEFDTVPPGTRLVSGVYQLLSQGHLRPDHPDHPAVRRPGDAGGLPEVTFHTSGLQLRSVLAEAWGADPPVTNKTASFSGCLDYLWASPQHWAVLEALELPYPLGTHGEAGRGGEEEGGRDPRLPGATAQMQATPESVGNLLATMPNERFPSDHLALGARLALHA